MGILSSASLRAHSPTEISYFFKLDKQKLVIHLTPKSVADLLVSIHPDLKGTNVFKFSDYHSDLEKYFNNNLLFTINEKPISIKLVQSNLTQHDATLDFRMENLPSTINAYKITVKSFTDIYQKGKNYLFVYYGEQKQYFVLNKKKTETQGSFSLQDKLNQKQNGIVFTSSLAFLLLSLGLVFYRKNKRHIKPY